MGLMAVFFFFLFLLYFIMLPAKDAPNEMKVAYYILIVPDWLKEIAAWSFLGFLGIIPIYTLSKTYKPALLSFENEQVTISGETSKEIPFKTIRKIFFNDVRHILRKPKEAMEVVIIQTGKRKTSFLLNHYVQAEELIEVLGILENVDFAFYNETGMEFHDET